MVSWYSETDLREDLAAIRKAEREHTLEGSISGADRLEADALVAAAHRHANGERLPGSVREPVTDPLAAADLDRLAEDARRAREAGDVANAPTLHALYVERRRAATAAGRVAPASRHYDRGSR